jgi:hypothetical protein
MNSRFLIKVVRGLMLLVLASPLWAVPATLKPLKGDVYIQHPKNDLWDRVKKEISISEGDRIKTNTDSSAFLILPDDHRVALGPDTFVTLERMAEGETKIFLKNGSVRNKVRKLQLDLGQFYKVQTPTAVCAVRGTDFAVIQNMQARIANVHVFEGMVDLNALRKDIANSVTHVEAGNSAVVNPSGTVEPPKPTEPPKTESKTSGDKPEPKKDQHPDSSTGPKGPPPPGSTPSMPTPDHPATGGTGGNWYEHPESINPSTFNPDSTMGPGTTSGRPVVVPPPPPTDASRPQDPNNGNWTTTSFDPLSGTQYGKNDPNATTTSGGINIYNPLPTGNSTTPGTDPSTIGNQALFDTIRSVNLNTQLQGLLVAGLFQDGSVKLGPDGLWHQYADAIQLAAPNQVQFLNATMIANQPNTLNYQTASMTFNAALPTTMSALALATQTAFRGDTTGIMPGYYVTDLVNYRTNTVDYVQVNATGGALYLDATANRYVTKFDDERCVVNGTTLYHITSLGPPTYLGGSAPVATYSVNSGMANIDYRNTYSNGVFLGRHVTFFNPDNQQIANLGMAGSTGNAQGLLGGPMLVVQDTLISNLFTKGPIISFASAQSRILGGIDSVVNNGDAASILTGQLPVGMPDGLLRL